MAGRRVWMVSAAAAAAIVAVAWSALAWRRQAQAHELLVERTAQRAHAADGSLIDCAALARGRPLAILVLGQSNAGNHGSPDPRARQGVQVIDATGAGSCHFQTDPLPGATGRGGSIWGHLPAALAAQGVSRPLVFAVLAVDATSISDWTGSGSPLPGLLDETLRKMAALGMPADLVLWQQGESDARLQTAASVYMSGLNKLAAQIGANGRDVPLVLAKSTVCRSAPSAEIRDAVDQTVAADSRFQRGPDTDSLASDIYRSDGCHFSALGLQQAALLWAGSIAGLTR